MTYNMDKKKEDRNRIHPIWRAVGFFMIVFIPLMAYALSVVFFNRAPPEILRMFPAAVYDPFVIPGIDYKVEIAGIPMNLGIVVMTVVFAMILFSVFGIVYSIFYSMAGPDKYGPTDAPPERRKVRKSR